MRTFDFCLPTKSASVPVGPDWLHEIKYDGYRLRLERDGDRLHCLVSQQQKTPPAPERCKAGHPMFQIVWLLSCAGRMG
jgi:hypothetical protein